MAQRHCTWRPCTLAAIGGCRDDSAAQTANEVLQCQSEMADRILTGERQGHLDVETSAAFQLGDGLESIYSTSCCHKRGVLLCPVESVECRSRGFNLLPIFAADS